MICDGNQHCHVVYTSALNLGQPRPTANVAVLRIPRSSHSHDGHTMSSTNFAAAQERVLERRRLREAEARARRAEQHRASPINSATVQRLPYPLNRLPGAGWSLWNTVNGREGTRPAFRVGQVDAELLDEELLGLLKNQVGDALKYFGVCTATVSPARFTSTRAWLIKT